MLPSLKKKVSVPVSQSAINLSTSNFWYRSRDQQLIFQPKIFGTGIGISNQSFNLTFLVHVAISYQHSSSPTEER
jgi:hypothetical protein